MVAPIAWACPPAAYGPWEAATSSLTEALVARGHEVTLYAAGGSRTAGRLRVTVPAPYEEDRGIDPRAAEALHLGTAMAEAEGLDVVHAQCDFPALAFAPLIRPPLVATIHGLGPPDVQARVLPVWRAFQDRAHYVAISRADRHPSLRYAATIHHGLRLADWPLADPGPDAPLLFFGRSHPEKGPARAIAAAGAAGVPLLMAGIVQDRAHHEAEVAPHLDGASVRWLGAVGGADRARLLGSARALLHLIDFEEPFGLAVAEAMATGTPVIATRRGAMPELIEDGVTGFLIDDPEEAPDAIARLGSIDRRACCAHVEATFTDALSAARHEALYRRLAAAPASSASDHGDVRGARRGTGIRTCEGPTATDP
jgi:glycosyltransferase involved in cell wall biosynthesis